MPTTKESDLWPISQATWDALRSHEGFWYVATPHRYYPRGQRMAEHEAGRVGYYLTVKLGLRVFVPIIHSSVIQSFGYGEVEYEEWLKIDEPFLDAACGLIVVTMKSWEKSEGMRYEINHMERLNKPIYYIGWDA